MFDVVIRAGLVIDGTGAPGQRSDVGIVGDRVTALGELGDAEAALVLNAEDRVVAPGFIDPHSHSDWTLQANRDADSTIRQGVTTEIVGNCGISNAPVSDLSTDIIASRLRSFGHDGAPYVAFIRGVPRRRILAGDGSEPRFLRRAQHNPVGSRSRAPTCDGRRGRPDGWLRAGSYGCGCPRSVYGAGVQRRALRQHT